MNAAASSSSAPVPTNPTPLSFKIDRNTLGFEFSKLVRFLYDTVPQFIAPLDIQKFSIGQSNPTYLLIDGRQQKYVLRKKPNGHLLSPKAHAIEREYELLSGIVQSGSDVPVPRVYALCSDVSILGTPFYIMEHIEGRIFPHPTLREIPRDERRLYWNAAIDALAKLHKINIAKAKISAFGPHKGYYARQLKTLIRVSDVQAQVKNDRGQCVGVMPGRDELIRRFESNMPKDEVGVVHGDYKFDNLIFHPREPKVVGVLDWELSTIGHPVSDLASLLMSHYIPVGVSLLSVEGIQGDEDQLGIPHVHECVARYEKAMSRGEEISSIEYYVAFVLFKYAVITQGVRARMYRGQASSQSAELASQLFETCAGLSLNLIRVHQWRKNKL